MLTPLEIVESELCANGFNGKIPKNERILLAGSDSDISDAPLGYYRYHFWLNSDTCKDHFNYVFAGKNSGYTCISMMAENSRNTSYYRVLIRSVMGWKSCIVKHEDIEISSKFSTKSLVIKEALRRFVNELIPETDHVSSDQQSPTGVNEIQISDTDERYLTSISRNSSQKSTQSTWTLSQLRGSFAESQDSVALSLLGSFSSLAELVRPENGGASEIDTEKAQGIREDLFVKFWKSAHQVKDKEFPLKLLDLEKSLSMRYYEFDLINLAEEDSEGFHELGSFLGNEVNRKESINYVKILTEKSEIADKLCSTLQKMDRCKKNTDVVKSEPKDGHDKLYFVIDEFIETERNYLSQLILIKEAFIEYLKHDENGKFFLKMKDFREIFGGICELIPIHEELLSDLHGVERNIDGFILAIQKNVRQIESKALYQYQSYFISFEGRMEALRNALNASPRFKKYHDDCVDSNQLLGKRGLDQFLIAPIQRMPRYVLLLREGFKNSKDEHKEALGSLLGELEKLVQFLNMAKHKAEQTEMLFMMQRRIANFPPELLRSDRMVLRKMACFLVQAGSNELSKIRYTLYLCNDMVVFGKKRSERKGNEGLTHDFILAAEIGAVHVDQIRGRKGDKSYFSVEIDMEKAFFSNNLSEADSNMFGCNNVNNDASALNGLSKLLSSISNNFQFQPKNPKKLASFISEFSDARNQFILSELPARLLHRQETDGEMFFHVFQGNDDELPFLDRRSSVAIVYVEQGDEELRSALKWLVEYGAVMIIQGRQGTFRFCIRSLKEGIFTERMEWIEAGCELLELEDVGSDMIKSLGNAQLLVSLYPPYSRKTLQQQRYVLERAVSQAKASGIGSGIKGFISNLLHSRSDDNSSGQRLSRGSSLKISSNAATSSPLGRSSDKKPISSRDIALEATLSHLHL